MKVVIFVETKHGLYFKCDTFWSQSEIPSRAKVYSNNSIDEMKRLLQCVLPSNIYKDRVEYVKDKYDNAKLGYFLPDENLFENDFKLKDGTELSDLGKPKYLWFIKMNEISEWKITKENPGKNESQSDRSSISVESKSLGSYLDYKVIERDEMIDNILKEKDPE